MIKQSNGKSVKAKKNDTKLNTKETDFLLKLMIDSQFRGADVEVVHSVMQKLASIHKENING